MQMDQEKPSRLRRFGFLVIFSALGAGVGGLLCLFAASRFEAEDPHEVLAAAAPDRVYISTQCPHSTTALDLLSQSPGPRPVLTIPLDLKDSPERAELCRPAVSLLRREGSFLWRLLPEGAACSRLVAASEAWMRQEGNDPLEVPAWVVGGEFVRSGVSPENLAEMRFHGLLADAS